ncbi:MAG: hypothetical protein HAW67_02595 [Endozoicomonadaceae bacterium]|nr:hypothetical protein [Endozoicomonadaceae bacterium]
MDQSEAIRELKKVAVDKLKSLDFEANLLICQRCDNVVPKYSGVIDPKLNFNIGDNLNLRSGSVDVIGMVVGSQLKLEYEQTQKRTKELNDVKERTFYVALPIDGKTKVACVRKENDGYKVLPRYQKEIGMGFISNQEMAIGDFLIMGTSMAAKEATELRNDNKVESSITQRNILDLNNDKPKSVTNSLAIKR